MKPPWDRFQLILYRALRAAIIFLFHALLATVIILGVWGIDELFQLLWGNREPLIFGRMPLAWVFQAIDLVMIIIFGVFGAVEAVKELFRDDDADPQG